MRKLFSLESTVRCNATDTALTAYSTNSQRSNRSGAAARDEWPDSWGAVAAIV
jgi:hypothetical protein